MTESRFAALFVVLFVAHNLGDYWVQTDRQAADKVLAGWRGRIVCVEHVVTYTATALAVLLLSTWRLGVELDSWRVALALALSAVTHYLADRRWPLRWLALRIRQSAAWLDDRGGLALLDQSWHKFWLFVATFIVT